MLFNRYDKLQNLKIEKTEWTVRVRAQAVWKGINRETQEFKGLNVIFIDDSNSRIHAFVSAKICDLFDETLKEGHIYSLSNFHVRLYGEDEKNRAVRFKKHIYFANHTKLKEEEENLTKIAPLAFDLFDLHVVDKFVTDPRFLIDVVGIIQDRNINCVYSKDDESKSHIRFKMTDGRYTLNVTFFNAFGKEFEKALKDIVEEPIVIVIASAKVNLHEGAPCLNNYPATRFYLNIDHYCVKQLKDMMLQNSICINPVETEEENNTPILSVAEIKKLTKDYIEKKVRCQITVKKVEDMNNWYDYVCTSCEKEVNKVEGRYRCDPCKRNIPYPDKRFRLATVCNDSTGILPIVFPDDEIQRITGKNAFDIDNDDNEVGDDIPFPPTLKSFERKQYIVTLKIMDKNVNKSCNIYTATEINDPVEMLGNHNPYEAETVKNKDNSICIETLASHDSKHSPPTGKSSNKVRAREMEEKVPFEMDENVPIGKYKIVKTEKV